MGLGWYSNTGSSFNNFSRGPLPRHFHQVSLLMFLLSANPISVSKCMPRVSVPASHSSGLEGLAHGASVHHEIQLLVSAICRANQCPGAMTRAPARAFGLRNRGRVRAKVPRKSSYEVISYDMYTFCSLRFTWNFLRVFELRYLNASLSFPP